MSLVLCAVDAAGKEHELVLEALTVRLGDDPAATYIGAHDAEAIRAWLDRAFPRPSFACQECGAPASRHARVLAVEVDEAGNAGELQSVDQAHWCKPCAPAWVEDAPAVSFEVEEPDDGGD